MGKDHTLSKKGDIIMRLLLLLSIFIVSAAAQDLTVSSDSMMTRNRFSSSQITDSVSITNNSEQAILLDSARLKVFEWHFRNALFGVAQSQVMIVEHHEGRSIAEYFTLDSIGNSEYLLDFSVSSRPIFPINPSGDRCILSNFQIGGNFYGDMPVYPEYFTGELTLYFSGGGQVVLQLYSEDLRPATVVRLPHSSRGCHLTTTPYRSVLLDGRKLPQKGKTAAQGLHHQLVIVPGERRTTGTVILNMGNEPFRNLDR